MMVKYDKSTIDRLVAMANSGTSRAVIARRLDMPPGTVAYHCRTRGLISPRSSQGQKQAFAPGSHPYSDDDDAIIVAMLSSGHGYSVIADRLGRNRSSVRSRVHTLVNLQKRTELDMGLGNIALPGPSQRRRKKG